MRLWKPPHTGLNHDADVSFILQTRAARLGTFLCVKTQTSVLKEQHQCMLSTWVKSDVMSSTRDVIRRRHVLLRCADSSLNHEWSKTASFVSCLDACLDAVGVRPTLLLSVSRLSGQNMGASTSYNPMGLHGLLQGSLFIYITIVYFIFIYLNHSSIKLVFPEELYFLVLMGNPNFELRSF
jgi:hypothetical protein